MARRMVKPLDPKPKLIPGITPEERENQLIALAMAVAEQQLRDGTASSQVITHFLKLGSEKEQLELEKIRKENILLESKAKAIEEAEKSSEMYAEAIEAMHKYSGGGF